MGGRSLRFAGPAADLFTGRISEGSIGTSRCHKLSLPRISFATMCSPSSFPLMSIRTSDLRQHREMIEKNGRTLENNCLSWHPEVAKCAFPIFCFEKYWTSIISENPYFSRIPEVLGDRLVFKVTAILAFRSRKTFVEVRVLLESDTLFAFEAAEVPKNFFQLRLSTKHLCYTREIIGHR